MRASSLRTSPRPAAIRSFLAARSCEPAALWAPSTSRFSTADCCNAAATAASRSATAWRCTWASACSMPDRSSASRRRSAASTTAASAAMPTSRSTSRTAIRTMPPMMARGCHTVRGPLPGDRYTAHQGLVELGVEAAGRDQLVVAAPLDDPAVVDHHDEVGLTHRRQAVGDHDRRPAFERLVEGRLHLCLVLAVEVAGGLVEDDDARVLEQHAGDGDPLLLAAREPVAALAHDGVVALGERGDHVVDLGAAARRLQLGDGGARAGRSAGSSPPTRGTGAGPGPPRRWPPAASAG